MPPKATATAVPSRTAKLSLPEWLKVLSSRGVDMRLAMKLAAKIYKTYGTIELLSEMSPAKVTTLTEDKEARKIINNAVKSLASGESTNKGKKRAWDSDLLQPLKTVEAEEDTPLDMNFQLVTDLEELMSITLTANRAPVKTAWAYTICIRLGFTHLESLSFAQAYVHINSLKHALMLGNILGEQETKDAKQELEELPDGNIDRWDKNKSRKVSGGRDGKQAIMPGNAQPWIGIMGAKPIIERSDETCRAIQKGVPVRPSQAYQYITKTFKDNSGHVMGALKIVADSYEPAELNRIGLHMYNEFKPDVVEWGQRGTLELAKVLEHVKGVEVGKDEEEGHEFVYPRPSPSIGDEKSPIASVPVEREREAAIVQDEKRMTLEEYEAMLEAEDLKTAV